MKRTQLYLDQETWQLALQQAKMEKTTLSDIMRKSLKVYVKPKPEKNPKELIKWIEALNKKYPTPPGTPADLALEHDHYLYGTPKKYTKSKK